MTYARKMAIAANNAAKRGNSVIATNGEQYAAVESVIAEVIERCAQEAESEARGEDGVVQALGQDIADRIRALAGTTQNGG